MAGATVVAIHVPSGTQYGAQTNADGFYSINCMRPGGPYIIEVSFVGYAKKTLSEIYISLGEAFIMNTSVEQVSAQLGEVVVTGTKPPIYNSEKNYYSLTAKLEKAVDHGFQGMVVYTHSGAKNLVDGSGDQAASAWNGNANVNGANSAALSYASYVIPDKVIGSASYRLEDTKMAWTVSLFYEGGPTGRFSYVYSTNIVRDGAGTNNLI